jgi:N-carbamoylputrescine amidase
MDKTDWGDMRVKVTVCTLPDEPDAFEPWWAGLCRHAREQRSELVVLPELAGSRWFPALPEFQETVWREALETEDALTARLPELGVRIVVGSRAFQDGGKRHNQGYYWTEETGLQGIHLKYYMPEEDGFHETRWFDRPAPQFQVGEVEGVRIGTLVCTDVFFNERARQYGREEATIVAVPRTASDLPLWPVAIRMAAVASGAFALSSNRITVHPEKTEHPYGGAGMVVSPDGEVLAATSPKEPYVTVEVNLDDAMKAKQTYPRYVAE